MLLENCKEVASNPDLGKFYSGITRNLLGFKAGRHIIFYRMIEDMKLRSQEFFTKKWILKIE